MASSILAGVVWVSSARASAAGITTTPGCSEDSVVTSSSSTAWAAVPLAMAAQTAEVFWFVPMTVALPAPPRSSATVAAGGLEGWRLPASATPIRSSSSSRVRAFTSSSSCAHVIAAQNPASSSAAVPGGADVEVTATTSRLAEKLFGREVRLGDVLGVLVIDPDLLVHVGQVRGGQLRGDAV